MRTQTFLVLALLVLGLHSKNAQADEPKVGVAVVSTINVSPDVGHMVSEALGKALEARLSVRAVAGRNAQAKVPEAALDPACLGDLACMVAAGKALEVDQVLMILLVGLGEQLKVETTWVNVTNNTSASRPAFNLSLSLETMATQLEAQAQVLLPEAPVRAKPPAKEKQEPTKPVVRRVQEPPAKAIEVPKGRHLTPTSRALLIGGASLTGAAVAYGGIQLARCGGRTCDSDPKTLSLAADIVAGVGIVALAVGTYMYVSSTEDDSYVPTATPPVTIHVDTQSVGLAFGARF